MENLIDKINNLVWGTPTVSLIIFAGILTTAGNGFFQFINFNHWLKESLGCFLKRRTDKKTNQKNDGRISQFQAICTALAATVGNGNISGVATAIVIGGPGAVLWMWISAFFGMMTAYSENVLGMCFRKYDASGCICGGPMYYLRDGVGKIKGCRHLGKVLAVLFSVFCLIASFGIGNMTQVNTVSSALKSNFDISELKSGIALSALTAVVIIGGVKRIGKFTEKLVPVMSVAYIVIAISVMIFNYQRIPYIFEAIISNAFDLAPIVGAGSGIAMKKAVNYGFRRGIFSNEAGLGSTVIINSASDAATPVKQGILGIFEVFFDTIIICSLTSFILLSSSSDCVGVDKALSDLSRNKQYVTITNQAAESVKETPLITKNATLCPENRLLSEVNKNTQDFESVASDDYTYANLMTVKGVTVDDKGKIISNSSLDINAAVFEKVDGIALVTYAVSGCFGNWAGKIIAIASVMFAFSTIIGWSYYGIKSWEFLFGKKALIIYKIIFVIFALIGSMISLEKVWMISDIFNAMMVVPNLIGVILLSGTVFKITKEYRHDVLKNSIR